MRRTRIVRLLDRMWAHVVACDGCSVSRYHPSARDTRCARGTRLVGDVSRELRRRFGR